MLALVIYNHAAFQTSIPDLVECVRLIDIVDGLVDRYGLRRYLVPARYLRTVALCLQGDLAGAATTIASIEDLFAEGFDAWAAPGRRADRLSPPATSGGAPTLDPDTVGEATPTDPDLVIEISTLRADAHACRATSKARGARSMPARSRSNSIVRPTGTAASPWSAFGSRLMPRRRRREPARSAGLERAQSRAQQSERPGTWPKRDLERSSPLVDAYSRAIEAEVARVAGDDVGSTLPPPLPTPSVRSRCPTTRRTSSGAPPRPCWKPDCARPQPSSSSRRERSPTPTDSSASRTAITTLARAHQLRLGPARTTVDGDDAALGTRARGVAPDGRRKEQPRHRRGRCSSAGAPRPLTCRTSCGKWTRRHASRPSPRLIDAQSSSCRSARPPGPLCLSET